ncbi:tetratricopeptide repeat protein [Streptomyces roseirectus]|uniref:Tetratricopeptide repeat protein n=1 Tax=Streptomyces roseirectus TaxID=2768066 RepID=A0A7H0IR88_9ACTN|nr:tetratricopeptide repeat protein [Streptomyces roseirectus]QNP75304.1 tetratricopeptide repeat protein [Streptomyces roseirectus]
MTSSPVGVGRRREALFLASGPVLGAAVGAVTNVVTSTWSWWLFGALVVLISAASAVAVLVPGNGFAGRRSPPCTLPPGAAVFAGRERELRALLGVRPSRRGTRPFVCVITGRSGSGKTELAVQAAHRLAGRYPAGQLFVGYRSHADAAGRLAPLDALAALLTAVGATQTSGSLSGQWQAVAGSEPFLLVLDDVDDASQVLEVLPRSPRCLVLVTGRRMVAGIDADLHIAVDTLTEEAARSVLDAVLRRGSRAVDGSVLDGLAAAYRLPLTVRHLADRLVAEPVTPDAHAGSGGNRVSGGGLAPVLATIQALAASDRLVLRRAALHPGPHVTAEIAAALAGTGLADAEHSLTVLHRRGLLMRPDPHGFGFHDLVRSLARTEDTVPDDDASAQARVRLFEVMACLLRRANTAISASMELPVPDSVHAGPEVPLTERQALEWLDHHLDDLRSVARLAVECAWPRSWWLTAGLAYFLRIRRNLAQAEELNEAALRIALASGDLPGQAHCRAQLGTLHRVSGRYGSAEEHTRTALALFADLQPGEPRNQAACASELGVILYHSARYAAAREVTRQAVGLYRSVSDRRGEANGLGNLGMFSRATGDYREARDSLTRAYALYAALGNHRNRAWILIELGTVDRLTGDQDRALTRFSEALDLYSDAADRNGRAWARRELGIVHRVLGHHTEARALLDSALREFEDLGSPRNIADAHVELGTLHRALGDLTTARVHTQTAHTLYADMGNRRGEAWAELELGALDAAAGHLTSAAGRFNHAQHIHTRIGDRSGNARAHLELGRLELTRENRAEARTHLTTSLTLYTQLGAPQSTEARDLLAGL